MRLPEKTIRNFLHRVIHNSEPCCRISLHVGSTKVPPFYSTDIDPQDYKGSKLDTFVNELVELISENAEDDEDSEECFILANWEDGDKEMACRLKLRKNANSTNVTNILANQNVKLAQINANMCESIMRWGSSSLGHSARVIEELSETRSRMLEAEEKAIDRSHERQLEAKREEFKLEAAHSAVRGFLALAPMLVGKIGGITALGADTVRATPQYQTLKAIFEEVPEKEWPVIYQWLNSNPLPVGPRAALSQVIETLIGDMAEKERSNGNGKAATH